VFDTNKCGCDFSTLTFQQALSLSSGNTICDAQGKLFQMGVAALLNACSGSGVNFPISTAQIISEVNTAIDSCDRSQILGEASALDALNNGPGGCPLGGRKCAGGHFAVNSRSGGSRACYGFILLDKSTRAGQVD
jgi:hypothetical protein